MAENNAPAPAAAASPATAAAADPAAAPTAKPAPGPTAKPEAKPDAAAAAKPDLPSFDEQVAADLALKKARKQLDAETEARRKEIDAKAEKYKPLEPVLEQLTKGEVIDAIWSLTGGKLTPQQVIALADRVAEQTAEAEVPVGDRIKAAIEADRQEQEAKAAETKRLDEEAKAEEGKKAWASDFADYIQATVTGSAETPSFLKAHEKEFPLCVAWRDKLALEDIETELKRRLAAGESVEAGEVFKVFEERFQADIDRTPYGKKPAPAEGDSFEAEETRFLEARKPRPRIEPKQPDEAPYGVSSRDWQPPPGKDFDDAVAEHLAKLDRDRRNRARF